MGELECPVDDCEYSTETNRGLSIHASQKHPDLEYDFTSRETDTCDYCGEEYKYYPSRRNQEGRENYFCGVECADEFKAKDGLDTKCTECDKNIHIPPSQIDEVDGYEQKNYFCSKDCESSFKSREWSKEDHPSWNGGKVSVTCNQCGKEYKVRQSKENTAKYCSRECATLGYSVDKKEYECVNCGDTVMKKPYNVKCDVTTCSGECFGEYISSIRSGEDNSYWRGGKIQYYGSNWKDQREKALERDNYECQDCGMSRDEHYKKYNSGFDVHHKIPLRNIIDENNPTIKQFEDAHSLDNLVTLCKSCHSKIE